MPTLDEIHAWVKQQVHDAAEEIGHDLQDVAKSDRAACLADFASGRIYDQTGEMAEAFRLIYHRARQWITDASKEYSL